MELNGEARDELVQRARQLWEAREFASLAEALAPVETSELVAEPSLGYYLADARLRLGQREEALRLVRLVEPAFARRGNDRLARERLNLEGILLFGTGDLPGAEGAWMRLLDASMRAGDETLVARVNQNFGVVYTLRGEWDRALVSYERAVVAYQRLGYLRGLAQVNTNLGITHRETGLFREGDQRFLQAIEYAQMDGSRDEVWRARIERALLLCYEGDLPLARLTAERALGAWRDMGDSLHSGEARRVLSIIALAGGSWEAVEEHGQEALSLATGAHAALLEAESREILAAAAEHAGDGSRARELRQEAEALFAAIGSPVWGRNLRSRLESLAAPA